MAIIKITELAYVRLRVPDLAQARRFFVDFGLIESASAGGFYGRANAPHGRHGSKAAMGHGRF